MKFYLLNAFVAAIIFGVLDSIWFAVFMKKMAVANNLYTIYVRFTTHRVYVMDKKIYWKSKFNELNEWNVGLIHEVSYYINNK